MKKIKQAQLDFIVSVGLVFFIIAFVYFLILTNTKEASVNEFFLGYFLGLYETYMAPFYPGYRLIYPPLLASGLLALLCLVMKVERRIIRLVLNLLFLSAWVALGLVTIIRT